MTRVRALAGAGIVGAGALLAIVVLAPGEWGPPGTASYRVYELVNRVMGLMFAAMAAAPVALRLAHGSAAPGHIARIGLWLATIGAVGMAAGSIAEFWVFSDAPYQGTGSAGRNIAFLVFFVSGLLLLAASVVTGIALVRERVMPSWVGWDVLLAGPVGIAAAFMGASLLLTAPLIALAMGVGALVGPQRAAPTVDRARSPSLT